MSIFANISIKSTNCFSILPGFSLENIQLVFSRNQALQEKIRQYGEALVVLEEQLSQQSHELKLWKEKCKEEQEKCLKAQNIANAVKSKHMQLLPMKSKQAKSKLANHLALAAMAIMLQVALALFINRTIISVS